MATRVTDAGLYRQLITVTCASEKQGQVARLRLRRGGTATAMEASEHEIETKSIAVEHKRIYFNLRENQRGRFLKVSLAATCATRICRVSRATRAPRGVLCRVGRLQWRCAALLAYVASYRRAASRRRGARCVRSYARGVRERHNWLVAPSSRVSHNRDVAARTSGRKSREPGGAAGSTCV